MTVEQFVDTNVLLYAYNVDNPIKREVALKLIERGYSNLGSMAISVQVLMEFFVNFVRAGRSTTEAALVISDLTRWPITDNSLLVYRLSLTIQARWQVSLWDAMILAAAQTSGARELLTEDLNHGQDYGGVVVKNPFL